MAEKIKAPDRPRPRRKPEKPSPTAETPTRPTQERAGGQRPSMRGLPSDTVGPMGGNGRALRQMQQTVGNQAMARVLTPTTSVAPSPTTEPASEPATETTTGDEVQAPSPAAGAPVAPSAPSAATPSPAEEIPPEREERPTASAESGSAQAETPAAKPIVREKRTEEQRREEARPEAPEAPALAPAAETETGETEQVGATEGGRQPAAEGAGPAGEEAADVRTESEAETAVAEGVASGEIGAALAGAAMGEGAGGAPGEAPALDTGSSEGLLQSLAAAPPSAFGQAVAAAKTASTQVQTQEKTELEASFPEIERPTGLPRQSERPQGAPLALGGGQAPEPEGAGGREGEAPETRHEEAAGPLPGSGVSTTVAEPSSADEGSWWDWLVNRVRRFLGQLPTSDPSLSTSAGQRPNVDLTGDADPGQNAQQQQAADQEVASQRTEADAATMAYFGENDIYPTAPQETLRPSYTPGPPPAAGGGGAPVPVVSDEARALFDQGAAPWLSGQVNEQLQQQRENRAAYEERSQEVRAQGEQQIADETARVRGEQEGMQEQARSDVDAERQRWRMENARIQEEYATKSQAKRQEIDSQIQEKVQTAESEADKTLADAEEKAEAERIKAETKAAAKKREAENRPRSWWDRVKGAVSDAIDAIRDAVNAIFDALRKLVKQIIEAAKAVVRGIIEAARVVIVGLIKGFGLFLKGLVTIALVAFPETAAAAREWIDGKVDTAVDAVNTAADALKEATDAILDWVGEALDMALAVMQAAFNLALDVLEFLALGMIELMRLLAKLVELVTNIGPIIESIWDLIQDPTPAIEAIKEFLGGLIAQVPAQAIAITKAAITFSDPPANHWQGIWNHLKPKLDYLAAHWWDVIKETAWFMIWPFDEESPLWKEVPELWDTIGEAFSAIWQGDFNTAIDKYLRAQQLIVNIINLFYGWVFLGLVIGYGIAGGIAGAEVGVIPGVIAGIGVGAGIAAEIGLGLVAATAAAEGAILAKAGFDLAFMSQTPKENDEDYERIASSGLVLAIIGALFLLGAIAARIGKAILSRAGRVAGVIVETVLGPRAVEWLEAALRRIRLKIAEVEARLRGEGKLKLKSSSVTKASYEGPARRLHPERFDEIITNLDRNGVEINVRDVGDPWTGSYQPGRPGEPGRLNVHRDVDLRTLEHEYKHFLDDKAKNYPGLKHYLENPAEMWEMERAAYDREIELVNKDASLTTEEKAAIIKELESAKALEKERLLGSGS